MLASARVFARVCLPFWAVRARAGPSAPASVPVPIIAVVSLKVRIAPECPEAPEFGKDGVMPENTLRGYPPELKERAVRMYVEMRSDYATDWEAVRKIGELLGVSMTETVRKWVRQAEVDTGDRAGVTTNESDEIKRANAILKTASSFSRPSSTGRRGDRDVHQRVPGPSRRRWSAVGS